MGVLASPSGEGCRCKQPLLANRKIFLILFSLFYNLAAEPVAWAQGPQQQTALPQEKGVLRQAAEAKGLLMGTVINASSLKDPLQRATIANEFNAGVAMVFMRLTQPQPDQFNFQEMDTVIQFAREYGIKLAGHALVYRLTTPDWLDFGYLSCGGWEKDSLDRVLKKHIQTVVAHGGDNFYVWDVVNEPFTNDGKLIPSCWYRVLGEDYIANALRYAHEANPKALLRLNDTFGKDGVNAQKAEKYFDFIKKLKDQGVPIHVAGIQMHLEAQRLRPTYVEEFRTFLRNAQEVGVQVHVTEMDVYQGPDGAFDNPLEIQKEIFKAIMSVCLEFSHCTSFATWGVTDKFTWLKTRERTPYQSPYPDAKPLLFDEYLSRKPAYFGIVEAIQENQNRP